jgi:hypothetical protein
MPGSRLNGWREVLARIFDKIDTQVNVTPDWLTNPVTHRRLKLDYYYPQLGLAVRFVGLQAAAQKRRKSDEEVEEDEEREDIRATQCREHGVRLVSINPDGEPRESLRALEMATAGATSQLALGAPDPEQRRELMPLLAAARQRVGEFRTKLTIPDRLNLYAEMWQERETALRAQAPLPEPSGVVPDYRIGMSVEHPRFGYGTVTQIAPDGEDRLVTVDFGPGGVHDFSARLACDKLIPY